MKIKDVISTVGRSGYFNKDLAAVKAGAKADGFHYLGKPVTPGFTRVQQPGASVSVMLVLEDGQVAFGDCMDVILSAVAGRDPLFRLQEHMDFLKGELTERLKGRDISKFRPVADEIDGITKGNKQLHTALRYGITQALLHGAALANHKQMAQVIAEEYDAPLAKAPVPILGSSGTGDWEGLDRLILKEVEILPHSSFSNVERDLGWKGEKLVAYAARVVKRIKEIGEPGYKPTIHLDCYGTFGELFNNDVKKIVDYCGELKDAVGDLALMIESPIIAKTRQEQIEIYHKLCRAIEAQGRGVEIIVDEWCNNVDDVRDFSDAKAGHLLQVKMPDIGGLNRTIEGVLYARRKGLGVSLGGSLNETDQSARITAHVGLATQPTYMFAKPGAGGDTGLMIEGNEMQRALALIART